VREFASSMRGRDAALQQDAPVRQAREAALRLSPRARVGSSLLVVGAVHFFSRRFDEAVPKLLLAIQENASYSGSNMSRAVGVTVKGGTRPGGARRNILWRQGPSLRLLSGLSRWLRFRRAPATYIFILTMRNCRRNTSRHCRKSDKGWQAIALCLR